MASIAPYARIAALAVLMGTWRPAIAADAPSWLSGQALQEQLSTPLDAAWDNAPLERVLKGLGKSQRVAILRDRRVDPTRPVTLAVSSRPLGDALGRIARNLGIGYCQFGPVAYFGPLETTDRLRTLAALELDEVARLPQSARRKFLVARAWRWPRLAEPRNLAAELASEAGVELVGADRIGHDLWPAADLPPLSWIDRLMLLAAQFDLTFRIAGDGRRVELVGLPDKVVLARTYVAPGNPAQQARLWAEALPAASVEVAGGKIRVTGRLEDHEYLEARLRASPTRRTTVTAGEKTYQLSVESAALDKVVDQLARQLDLEIEWDRPAIAAAGIAVDQLVSRKIKDATLDELLAAVFAGSGLAFERTGRKVVIRPK